MNLHKKISLFVFMCLVTLKITAQSIGGSTTGTQTYCDTSLNSGFISVTGYVGNIITWLYSTDGGINYTSNGNTFSNQSYYHLQQSTCYKAVVQNGAFPPDTSSVSCITIYLPTVAGTILGGGTFCGSSGTGTLNLSGNIGNVLYWQFSTTNGSTWSNITNTTTTLAYSPITQNTLYRAIVQNSSFCISDTSSTAAFVIDPLTVSGSLNSVGSTTVCYAVNSSSINLSGNVGNILYWISSTDNGLNWSTISNTTNSLIVNGLTTSTKFKALVQSANCSIDSTNGINFTVLIPPAVNAGPDTTISQGQSASLNGIGTGTPFWSPSSDIDNSTIFNPQATPIITTNYILTVTDANSCSNSDTVLITVIPLTFNGIISNVFSPNGDGINDTWYIENIKYYPKNEVSIYNIYGNIVFNKQAYNNDWDGTFNGKQLPDGTYYYVVKVDETSAAIKGSLDILRNK